MAAFERSDAKKNPSNYSVLITAEGAMPEHGTYLKEHKTVDAFGHVKLGGIGHYLKRGIKKYAGIDVVYQPLAYIIRSGTPVEEDHRKVRGCAGLACELIHKKHYGVMAGIRNGKFQAINILKVKKTKQLKQDLFDSKNYRPILRQMSGKPHNLHG